MNGKTINTTSGETVLVTNQWAAQCEQRAATIASSAWAGAATLGAETLTGTVATALIAVPCDGYITNTVTLSNGETLMNERQVRIS